MKIVDEKLLQSFRDKIRCEWCGRSVPVQPHHIFSRGQESCYRLDIAINLIAVCVEDHLAIHAGNIARFDLLAIVARRENTTQDAIEQEIYRLRRERK